jgi:hypothetical protein
MVYSLILDLQAMISAKTSFVKCKIGKFIALYYRNCDLNLKRRWGQGKEEVII